MVKNRALNSSEEASARGAGNGPARIPPPSLANPIPAGRLRGRRGRLNGNAVLDESGLSEARRRRRPVGQEPCVQGDRAWRAGAHGEAHSPRARGAAHSHGFPGPAAPRQQGLVLTVSPQPTLRAVCKYTCTSRKDASAIPPPAWRPRRCFALGPALRSNRKDKRAMGPPQPAVISTSHDPGRGNPRGQGELLRGLLAGQPEGVERPRWRCPRPRSCGGVLGGWRGGSWPVGAQEAAEWQSRVRACASPCRLPDTAQLTADT